MWQGIFADISLTVADYFRTNFVFPGPVSGMNVVNLQMTSPVVMPLERPTGSKMLQIVGEADLGSNSVHLRMGTQDDRSGGFHTQVTCEVIFGDSNSWAQVWNKNAYLILERMKDLEREVGRTTSRISHEMIYKLFSNVVQYDDRYQGMQEVIVDSQKLEAVVSLVLYEGKDAGKFFCSPLWLDNLAQIAGFVMNAIGTVNPREFTYISHGIDSYQIAESINAGLPYRAHVRMLPEDTTVFAGDVSIFQGDRMIARCGDVKFKKIPRALIERILSSSAEQKPPVNHLDIVSTRRKQPRSDPKPIAKEAEATAPNIGGLKKLLASQIGISEDDLRDESTFIELGVDSLLSMTILSEIRDSLNLELPASSFTDLLTFGDLRNYVSRTLPDQPAWPLTPSSSSSEFIISLPPSVHDQSSQPSTDIRLLEVYSIIANEIGVDVQDVLTAEDLSVLGLDSLMAISILGALEDKIGVRLPSDIFDASLSKDMHNFLNQMFGGSISVPAQHPQMDKTPEASKRKTSFPSSIILQDGDSSSKTLFLFPDGSGLAGAYAKLPRISSDIRVCGLNSPLLYSTSPTELGIEAMATRMVQIIRERQPHGPYLLGGWSAGGFYAFEAVRELLQSDEQVDALILIDSPCRLQFDAMPTSVLNLITSSRSLSCEIKDHFLHTIGAVKKYAPRPLPRTNSMQATIIWAKSGLEMEMEKSQSLSSLDYRSTIVEWLVKRSGPLDALGWDKLLPGINTHISTVPGNHFSMMQESNVSVDLLILVLGLIDFSAGYFVVRSHCTGSPVIPRSYFTRRTIELQGCLDIDYIFLVAITNILHCHGHFSHVKQDRY